MWRHPRTWVAMLLFSAGLAVVPTFVIYQLIFGDRKPHTEQSTSPVWILFAIGFFICCISPLFAPFSRSARLAVAAAGALVFLAMLCLGVLILGFVFLPVH